MVSYGMRHLVHVYYFFYYKGQNCWITSKSKKKETKIVKYSLKTKKKIYTMVVWTRELTEPRALRFPVNLKVCASGCAYYAVQFI